jgi:DNA modification methylase
VTLTPYYSDDFATIYHGDSLEVLDALDLGEGSVDAILTDPPYASGARHEADKSTRTGGMVRGQRFADKPIDNDRMTTTGFVWLMRETALRTYDALVDGGSLVCFIDWRQWPNLVGAIETCNLRVQTMIVWDKRTLGMGNGFRQQHELACHAAKGVPNVYDRATPNVLTVDRIEPDDHPSPKPVALIDRLLRVVTPPGGLILDPFMGSGRPMEAAKAAGRRCIGIEKNEAYCERAAERLTQTFALVSSAEVSIDPPPSLDLGAA